MRWRDDSMSSEGAHVFLSYAHGDEELLEELKKHLASLRRKGRIHTWHDREILAGGEWADEIKTRLEAADLVLLLISADFIDSEFCWHHEMNGWRLCQRCVTDLPESLAAGRVQVIGL